MRSHFLTWAVIAAGAFGLSAASSLQAAETVKAEKPKEGKERKPSPPPRFGVKTPGVQIPMTSLKAEAEIAIEGAPQSLLFTDQVMLSNGKHLVRVDPKTNKTVEPIQGFSQPCGGLVSAFGSVWVPNCGQPSLVRIDPKTGKVTATIDVATAPVPAAIAASPDSVWLLSDQRTTISRIDPGTNSVVAEIRVEAGCNSIAFAETAVWVTCPSLNKVIRLDPRTNLATKRIEVAAKPVSLAFGEGSIWVFCQADGKVVRIDPKTDKVIATIELSIPNAEGNLAVGEGSVWVSTAGYPLSRIHPGLERPNADKPGVERVVQQFTGELGGHVQVGLKSVWVVDRKSGKLFRFDPKRIAATIAD